MNDRYMSYLTVTITLSLGILILVLIYGLSP
jgi:hypothetical protein